MTAASDNNLLALTADIVAAYVSRNMTQPADLPALIMSVNQSLRAVEEPQTATSFELTPAVPIKKSMTPDYIVCLEDGKKLKMLKRHLMTTYNLTPNEYRAKWGLPSDYPMVSPNYSKVRSDAALTIGLGKR